MIVCVCIWERDPLPFEIEKGLCFRIDTDRLKQTARDSLGLIDAHIPNACSTGAEPCEKTPSWECHFVEKKDLAGKGAMN
jgi:hypothetical protein